MKLRIEVSDDVEEEIIIRCKVINDEIIRLQKLLDSSVHIGSDLVLNIGNTEYYVPVDDILFFETEEGRIAAHTADAMYYTDMKLCELTQRLPHTFIRSSKSCIVNSAKIRSIDKNLTGASTAYFVGCHKKAFVSRMYYGALKEKIKETRID